MPESEKTLKPPCFIEVESFKDFARLVCSFEKIALPVFRFKMKEENILSVQFDVFRNTPIFYYIKIKDKGNFIEYNYKNGVEVAKLNIVTDNTARIYAPIIAIDKSPEIFCEGFISEDINEQKCMVMKVEDFASICKVALYKISYDETPLPLFMFPNNNKWILGAFTRMDEIDDTSIFFYIELDNKPEFNFVKYSSSNFEKTGITNDLGEHGYLYGKIIKLSEKHPLVDI